MTFLMLLLMENSINCLYATLATQTLSSVSVDKQPHTAPAPPGAVSAGMTEPMSRRNMPSVEDASSTTSLLKNSVQ